jgi:hypothetical protein
MYEYVRKDDRLNWKWMADAPVGFKVRLVLGLSVAYSMASKYGRTIKTKQFSDGDYEIEIIK